jgi:divalent metal cation (Fe/Co/Zn/Cd) transporter
MTTLSEPAARVTLARRGRRLEYFTILWNSLEGLVGVTTGALAGSVSLVGFGVDSFIEVTSGAALLWRMSADTDHCERERREARTLKIVGACFLLLAAYVGADAAWNLWSRSPASPSTPGIVLAAASLVAMPLLSRAKRRVARGLASGAMHADARQTEFCTYLSAILLGGLLLNALLGWWWADPIAALVMTPIIAKEGIDGLRGRACCD